MLLGGAAINNGWINLHYQYGISEVAVSINWTDIP